VFNSLGVFCETTRWDGQRIVAISMSFHIMGLQVCMSVLGKCIWEIADDVAGEHPDIVKRLQPLLLPVIPYRRSKKQGEKQTG